MKRRLFLCSAVLIGVLLFPSCKHNEIKPAEQELTVEESVPYFASDDEFVQALTAVSNMSDEERNAYEAQHNYQSIGSASEQFYQSIDFESFQDEGDIHQLVAENSDFLRLVEDEDGELMLETRYYNLPYRYLINRDGVAIIGDSVAKFFDSGVFKAHRSQLRQVARLQNVADCPVAIGRFESIKTVSPIVSGAKSTNCMSLHQEWDHKNGSSRLRARIYIYLSKLTSKCEVLVRPYKRTLGVWYWCSRHISADADITWGYTHPDGTWISKRMVYNEGPVKKSSLKKTYELELHKNYRDLGFEKYKVYFTTRDNVAPISSSCQ